MSEKQSRRGQVDRMLGQIVSHGRLFEAMTVAERQWVIINPGPAITLFMAAVRELNRVEREEAGARNLLITEVFTRELCEELGFHVGVNTRAHRLTHDEEGKTLLTLGDLAKRTRAELRRVPRVGDLTLDLIEAVLSQRGLHLGAPKL